MPFECVTMTACISHASPSRSEPGSCACPSRARARSQRSRSRTRSARATRRSPLARLDARLLPDLRRRPAEAELLVRVLGHHLARLAQPVRHPLGPEREVEHRVHGQRLLLRHGYAVDFGPRYGSQPVRPRMTTQTKPLSSTSTTFATYGAPS